MTSSTRIISALPATKIVDAAKQSGELTIEAWVKPQDDLQAGPRESSRCRSTPTGTLRSHRMETATTGAISHHHDRR